MPVLLVLGMHRSYTSLTGRWLSDCGIDLGDKLLPGHIGNPDGHFEAMDFYRLHERVLEAHGLTKSGLPKYFEPEFDTAAYKRLDITGTHAEQAEAILDSNAARNPNFGWKEPRTCLFLPFYEKRLDYRSLVLFRPFEEVVGSLLSRELKTLLEYWYRGLRRIVYRLKKDAVHERIAGMKDEFLKSWIHYNECLLEHVERTDPERVMVHDLQSLVENGQAVSGRLQDWGFDHEYKPLAQIVRPQSERAVPEFDPELLQQAETVTRRFRELIDRQVR